MKKTRWVDLSRGSATPHAYFGDAPGPPRVSRMKIVPLPMGEKENLSAETMRGHIGRPASSVVRTTRRQPWPAYARSSSAMSSFFIPNLAFMARCVAGDSGSANIVSIAVGTTCHDTP